MLFDDLPEGNHTLVVDVSPAAPDKLTILAERIASGQIENFPEALLNTTDFIPLAFTVA